MFDFSKMGEMAETIQTGLRDLDSRLEQIAGLLTDIRDTTNAIAKEGNADRDAILTVLDLIERNTRT